MATSVVPALIDALVERARAALPDTLVLDGFGTTNESPSTFLMIGVGNVLADGLETGATAVQSWAYANFTRRDEEGDVTCVAWGRDGDGDQKKARDLAYALTDAVAAFLRDDPTLGFEPQYVMRAQYGSSLTIDQDQDDYGALTVWTFSVHFQARI